MDDRERNDLLRYAWLGLLLILVLAVIVGPRDNGIPAVFAMALLLLDGALIVWLRTRRQS